MTGAVPLVDWPERRPKLLGPLTLRCTSAGVWWALSKRETGWSSFGYRFDYLGDALDRFDAELVSFGRDVHGLYLTAVGRPAVAS